MTKINLLVLPLLCILSAQVKADSPTAAREYPLSIYVKGESTTLTRGDRREEKKSQLGVGSQAIKELIENFKISGYDVKLEVFSDLKSHFSTPLKDTLSASFKGEGDYGWISGNLWKSCASAYLKGRTTGQIDFSHRKNDTEDLNGLLARGLGGPVAGIACVTPDYIIEVEGIALFGYHYQGKDYLFDTRDPEGFAIEFGGRLKMDWKNFIQLKIDAKNKSGNWKFLAEGQIRPIDMPNAPTGNLGVSYSMISDTNNKGLAPAAAASSILQINIGAGLAF